MLHSFKLTTVDEYKFYTGTDTHDSVLSTSRVPNYKQIKYSTKRHIK